MIATTTAVVLQILLPWLVSALEYSVESKQKLQLKPLRNLMHSNHKLARTALTLLRASMATKLLVLVGAYATRENTASMVTSTITKDLFKLKTIFAELEPRQCPAQISLLLLNTMLLLSVKFAQKP